MHSFILQDWLSIAGPYASPGSTITQEEPFWLDLAPFQDCVLYLDVRESGVTPATIAFETSPSKDQSLFQPLVNPATPTSLSASSTPQVISALMLSAYTPLARYLRWKVTGPAASAWEATFRVIVAANAPGM